MILKLLPVESGDRKQYKLDMQEAFQLGAKEGDYPLEADEIILPEADIEHSLHTAGALAYKAVDETGAMVGGAIVVIDPVTQHNHLDFLYVKRGVQNKGIGKFIWFVLEKLHPETKVWITCTPYFEKRNIHFYVNVCHFHIVDFFNAHYPDPNFPDAIPGCDEDGMFGFQKKMRN